MKNLVPCFLAFLVGCYCLVVAVNCFRDGFYVGAAGMAMCSIVDLLFARWWWNNFQELRRLKMNERKK